MRAMLSDAQFNSLALVLIAAITIIPTTLSAFWARSAKKESTQAKENSAEAKENSAEARQNSASALHEVQNNGGMSDPNPNLNDHIKYQTEMTEFLVRGFHGLRKEWAEHLRHSKMMDQALAEVYMEVRPPSKDWTDDGPTQPPPD